MSDSGLSPKVIEARLSPLAGGPLKIDRLEHDIADIYGLDAFESVTFDLRQEDGRDMLEIKAAAMTPPA